jgi:N-methylhydantoinase B/oxoprolinase/acetone carboxylase alpha subunit
MFIEHQAGRADRALRAQGFPVLDLVWLQILHAQLVNICEEMGLAMMRTSYSPIFSEGLDFCCLILDRDGELVAMQNLNPAMMGRALYSDAG